MRLLLVTLYFPPLNTIAAHRMGAFQSYLSKDGHEVDVLTRYYDNEQQKGNSMLLGKMEPKGFDKNYIRKGNVVYTNFRAKNSKLKISGLLPPGIRGLYNYQQMDVWHYGWIPFAKDSFEKELSSTSYDLIIASYGPPVVMRLAQELSEKHGIPYIIDFRDSYIDERDVSSHLRSKIRMQEKYLKNAKALLFATKGMRDYFLINASPGLASIPHCVVYNGVDENMDAVPAKNDEAILKQISELKSKYSLILLHTGTIYEGQNIDFFVKGVARHNANSSSKAAIVFLGAAENNTGSFPTEDFIYVLPKVSHGGSVYIQKQVSGLLLPVWDGRYTGFSGKTLEYIYSENFVITSPKPQEDLNDFLALTENVLIPKDEAGFVGILGSISKKELERKTMSKENKNKILRSYWVKELSKFLRTL